MTLIDYPGHLTAGLILIAVAAGLGLAFRSPMMRPLKYTRWILASLQWIVIAALCIILWNPSRFTLREDSQTNTLGVFFDTSRSMSVEDQNTKNRLDHALKIFQNLTDSKNAPLPGFRIYGFDDHCYRADNSDSLNRWGDRTNMTDLLQILRRWAANAPPTNPAPDPATDPASNPSDSLIGAVIFTDGQADDKYLANIPAWNSDNFKVIWIGLGSAQSREQITIESLETPDRVILNGEYIAKASLKANLKETARIPLTLRLDGALREKREITVDPRNDSLINLDFTLSADTLGEHTLELQIDEKALGSHLGTPARQSVVRVIEEPVLKVLLYTQVINMDFGKIRSALERDKKIKLDIGLDAVITPAASDTTHNFSGHVKLPTTKDGFLNYDVIILGPTASDTLTPDQIDGLYNFVAIRGGGLILLPGRDDFDPFKCKSTHFRSLIPVVLDNSSPQSPSTKTDPKNHTSPTLTPEGDAWAILKPDDMHSQKCPISPFYDHITDKPAGIVFARCDQDPLICSHTVGRGRVALINTNDLNRWYDEKQNGGLLRKFLSGLTTQLARASGREAGVELFATRPTDKLNNVDFEAFVYDASFAPADGATVLLRAGNQQIPMQETQPGRYLAQIKNLNNPSFLASAEAQRNGTFLGEKTITVKFPPARGELDTTELDRQFLQALAEKTHSKYFDADQCPDDLLKEFAPNRKIRTAQHMHSVWPCWPVLISLSAALIAIWIIRRAKGLI